MTFYIVVFVLTLMSANSKCQSDYGIGLNWANIDSIETLPDVEPKALTRTAGYDQGNIEFYVCTNIGTTKLYYNESGLLSSITGFNTSWRTVFVIHGWINSHMSLISTVLTEALLTHGNVNVITINWSYYSNRDYVSAVAKVPDVGSTLASFIEGMQYNLDYSLDLIILMGHSLGAHVSGFAGDALGGNIAVIIGMDPAGPLYLETLRDLRLNSGDAKYVQAIHTNAMALGVNYNVADADFWPNGGTLQPGCTGLKYNGCSHNRSYIYMAESINNDNFYGRKCGSYVQYLSGSCAANTAAKMGGLVYDTSITGVFYLQTSSTPPYAWGSNGNS